MNNEHRPRFVAAMKTLQVATGGKMDDEAFRVYWELLKEYPVEEFEAAAHRLCRTSKWFPKVAEIIGQMTPDEVSSEQRASDAWELVFKLSENSDTAAEKCHDEIALKTVNALGGFRAMGMRDREVNAQHTARNFKAEYVRRLESSTTPLERQGMIINDETAKRVIDSTVAALIQKPETTK